MKETVASRIKPNITCDILQLNHVFYIKVIKKETTHYYNDTPVYRTILYSIVRTIPLFLLLLLLLDTSTSSIMYITHSLLPP